MCSAHKEGVYYKLSITHTHTHSIVYLLNCVTKLILSQGDIGINCSERERERERETETEGERERKGERGRERERDRKEGENLKCGIHKNQKFPTTTSLQV